MLPSKLPRYMTILLNMAPKRGNIFLQDPHILYHLIVPIKQFPNFLVTSDRLFL